MRKHTSLLFPLFFLIPLYLIWICVISSASPIDPTDYAGPQPGARPLGLGNCGIAIENEPFSSFYNPASLCFMQSSMAVFDLHYAKGSLIDEINLPTLGGISLDFVAMLNQAGGLSWHPLVRRNLEVDSVYFSPTHGETVLVNTRTEYRADEVYTTMTTLTTEQMEVLLQKPLLGVNIKYFRAQCAEATIMRTSSAVIDAASNIDSGNGFGIDIGLAYATELFLFGLSVKDAFSRVYWKDYDTDRVSTKAGAGVSFLVTDRITLATDFRYDLESKISGSFSGLEMNFIKKTKPKTKHLPVGETEAKQKGTQGSIARIGVRIADLSHAEQVMYSLGYSYTLPRVRIDIALMGEQETIKDGDFSSQMSLLILY